MKINSFLFVSFASFLTGCALAGTINTLISPSQWKRVITISGGAIWESGGKTHNFYLTPDIEKAYAPSNSNEALATGELFLGLQKVISRQLQGQLGLAVATSSHANQRGTIWDDADPQFANYSYQYKVNHTYLGLKGKLLLDTGYGFIPWLGASIGLGFNDTHGFTNLPLFFEALPTNNFTNNTNTSFSYTVDAGIQKTINQHWQVGASYEFSDWGKNQLGKAAGQILNSGLASNHLYTNGLLFNLTYLV